MENTFAIHVSKTHECMWVTMLWLGVGSATVTIILLWYRMLVVGEAVPVGGRGRWEAPKLSTQFSHESKTAQKNK